MAHRIDTQRTLNAASIILSCISLFVSSFTAAAGAVSIQYGNQSHQPNNGHHQTQRHGLKVRHNQYYGAAGNVRNNQHIRHNSSSYSRNRHHYNHNYSYPRYRSYNSPAQKYNQQQYSQPHYDSRFPNSYRNHSYFQQTRPRIYVSLNNYSVNAWETLVQGQTRKALVQFGADAQSYPKAGIPKLGYALSFAASGNLNQSAIAMRRAFRIDPESLYNYQLDQRLHPMVYSLIDKYQYSLKRRSRQKDAAFMVAALSYLLGDYATAHQALERAKRDGDRSRSVKNLGEFVNGA